MSTCLTAARIVEICRRHHATPSYCRDKYGVHCTISDVNGRRVTSGYCHF